MGDMTDRPLWFPDDIAVGFLEAAFGEAVVLSGPARGRMRVPLEATVHLWVKCPVQGLGLLNRDDLTSIQLENKTATDADFGRLAHLTGLRELNASKSHDVGDAGLAAIASLQLLRELDVYASAVTDAGLAHIGGMAQLEHLHLGNTRVAGPGLAHLVGLQRLVYLKLDHTGVGDESIPYLLRLSALQRLTLDGTRMTTSGLARLKAGLPNLREIHMTRAGHRLAAERARAAVLGILARRLRPAPSAGSPEEELREMLPKGSRIAEIRCEGAAARAVNLALDDMDRISIILPALRGCDLRIVTPAGMDRWIRGCGRGGGRIAGARAARRTCLRRWPMKPACDATYRLERGMRAVMTCAALAVSPR
jgi:hypothetical protein